jgi:acetyl esterase/lipase
VPAYAKALGVTPSIERKQFVGMLLYCGAYTIVGIDLEGPFGNFLKTVLWSFSGHRNFKTDPNFAAAWVIDHVTADFPPTFISAGNTDPLLPQSIAFADALTAKGVDVSRLFFPSDYSPGLPHEYQFNLDNEPGQHALARSLDLLAGLKR